MTIYAVYPIEQDTLVAAVKALSTDFDAEDGVDVTAVSATFLDLLIAEVKEAWDGGCDHSVGVCRCHEEDILKALTMARVRKKECPMCQGNQIVWNPTVDDEDRETLCVRCEGRGWVSVTPDD